MNDKLELDPKLDCGPLHSTMKNQGQSKGLDRSQRAHDTS